MSKMTLEQVRDEMEVFNRNGTSRLGVMHLRNWLDAIDERIKADEMAPVAWMIEWDSEDDGHKCCPRKGQDKPRLDCFPEGTTAYPLFATPQQTSAVPDARPDLAAIREVIADVVKWDENGDRPDEWKLREWHQNLARSVGDKP